jgi:hypothetical protein
VSQPPARPSNLRTGDSPIADPHTAIETRGVTRGYRASRPSATAGSMALADPPIVPALRPSAIEHFRPAHARTVALRAHRNAAARCRDVLPEPSVRTVTVESKRARSIGPSRRWTVPECARYPPGASPQFAGRSRSREQAVKPHLAPAGAEVVIGTRPAQARHSAGRAPARRSACAGDGRNGLALDSDARSRSC